MNRVRAATLAFCVAAAAGDAGAVQDRVIPDRAGAFEAALKDAQTHASQWTTPESAETSAESRSMDLLPQFLDEESRTAWQETARERLAYERFVYHHRRRIYGWQHGSSIAIFVVVIGLVLAGLYFAWLQFQTDQRLPPPPASTPSKLTTGEADAAAATPAPQHAIELGAQGLKVTSPVLGVVILALALGFFYLYLVYVYPITPGA